MPTLPKRSVSTAAAPNRLPSPDESAWLDHLTRWREAGVCLAAYARSANLKVHQLYAWKSRLQTRGLWQDPEPVSFLPVHVLDSPSKRATAPSGMTMTLSDGVLLAFPSVPSPVFLADLLKHLVVGP